MHDWGRMAALELEGQTRASVQAAYAGPTAPYLGGAAPDAVEIPLGTAGVRVTSPIAMRPIDWHHYLPSATASDADFQKALDAVSRDILLHGVAAPEKVGTLKSLAEARFAAGNKAPK